MIKKALRKLLLAYRPLDAKLRRFSVYSNLSRRLQAHYNIMGADGDASARGLDVSAYVENFDQVVPRDDTILFECYWGKKLACNPLAMYRALRDSHPEGTFRILWAVAGPASVPDEVSSNPDVTLVRIGSPEYGIALLEAGYLVNNVTFPSWFIRRPGQHYCNTWHGVPMKAMGRDMVAPLISMANSQRNFLQSDVILEMSDYYRDTVIRPYYVEQLAAGSLIQCGAPRVDDVLAPKVNTAELRARYSIAAQQKIVLFAPTWRGNSTNVDQVFSDQASLCNQIAEGLGPDHAILFSAHQMLAVQPSDLVDNASLLADDENINDILSVVDVLVTDYSSILFDYLPLDRAVVLFTPDIDDYRNERGLYLEPASLPCVNTTKLPDLIAAIRVARRPSDFAGHAETMKRFGPFEDGTAAATALAALLQPATARSHRKPDQRKRILIAPGGLIPNGITSSLKSLIANLDYDRFDPYILVDAHVMSKEQLRMEQFQEFDARCNWILRSGSMLLSADQRQLYQNFLAGNDLDKESELPLLRGALEREARRIFGDAQFDVAIEFGGYSPYWTGLIAASNATRKICYQHNDLWAEYNNPEATRNHRQLNGVFQIYQWFDQIVAVSDETRAVNEANLKQFYPTGMSVRTVRNTLDVERVLEKAQVPMASAYPDANMRFHDNSQFRFIALGRLSPEKRYDRMIGAMAHVARDHPNAILLICGNGPLRDKLINLARQKGVGEQVRFLGQVLNPYPLLAHADALVMTSDYEGQPMALLEALCIGKPCIASDIPGIRAVLKGGLGHIVPPTEVAFAEAMKAAIEGRLPPLVKADMSRKYIDATMREFTEFVCDISEDHVATPVVTDRKEVLAPT